MTRRLVVFGIAAALVIVLLVVAVVAFDPFGPNDPASAACDAPSPHFGDERTAGTHAEVDVTYSCMGATQAATVYLPEEPRPHPAVVWVHGAGEATRISSDFPVFKELLEGGVAILTYDKRGVGASEGECCPGDSGHFNLLTADVEGAIRALRALPDIDPTRIGLIGASQAGWIAPRSAVETDAAFLALASAPTTGERIANRYQRLSSGAEGQLSRADIAERLKSSEVGFDPLPDLQRLQVPELWLYGDADDRTPVPESITILDRLKAEGHDITVKVYLGAGHGLLDTPPSTPDAGPELVSWVLAETAPSG
jgi:dipeptidyl aminopeptidase/acylaminoacyl peptidase